MTVEEFNNLNEEQKKAAIFDAKKITERIDQSTKYELFRIDNVFIETTTSLQRQFRRMIATFSPEEVQHKYGASDLIGWVSSFY